MDLREPVVIEEKFSGPPGVANGGYVSGLLAGRLGDRAEVVLHRPTPIGSPLALRTRRQDGEARVTLERPSGELLASARPAELCLEIPPAPSFAEAWEASGRARPEAHPFSSCFVCGPERKAGDGLRVFAGLVAEGRVAAAWIPDAGLADRSGAVDPIYLWAALDCPGAAAAAGGTLRPMLLGRMTGVLERALLPGDRCVALGFRLSGDGRKHVVGTALFDGIGHVVGRSLQVWIEPRGQRAAA